MSQVTITDVRDVRKMPEQEIQKWIRIHGRVLEDKAGGRYESIIKDDLRTLFQELERRKSV